MGWLIKIVISCLFVVESKLLPVVLWTACCTIAQGQRPGAIVPRQSIAPQGNSLTILQAGMKCKLNKKKVLQPQGLARLDSCIDWYL